MAREEDVICGLDFGEETGPHLAQLVGGGFGHRIQDTWGRDFLTSSPTPSPLKRRGGLALRLISTPTFPAYVRSDFRLGQGGGTFFMGLATIGIYEWAA